jgi:hypothetical protein
MKGTESESADLSSIPWRWILAVLTYWAFWITGAMVAVTLATFVLDRDGAVYVWAFINKWTGSEYTADTGWPLITWAARFGGYALTAAVIYGSWLRFKRWGQRLQTWILGEKPQAAEADDII